MASNFRWSSPFRALLSQVTVTVDQRAGQSLESPVFSSQGFCAGGSGRREQGAKGLAGEGQGAFGHQVPAWGSVGQRTPHMQGPQSAFRALGGWSHSPRKDTARRRQ